MRASKHRLAVVLVWVTALLLIAQPQAAMHCSCRAAAPATGQPATNTTAHQHCQHGCCHSHSKFRVVCAIARSKPVERTLHSGPCGCPQNCPCRLQHAQHQFGLLRSASFERGESATMLPFYTDIPVKQVRDLDGLGLPTAPPPSFAGRQLCSLLCRFTI